MNFLRVSKEKTHPKSLSEKRLRELERQQQEVEEESRFFAANKEGDAAQKPASHRKDRSSNNNTQAISNKRVAPTRQYRTRRLSRSSPAWSKPGRGELESYDQSSASPRHPSSHNTVGVGDQRSREASRAPTHTSWSSSRSRSPPLPGDNMSRSPSPKRVRRTASPRASERAMMETGIFRGTHLHDRWVESSEGRTPDTIAKSDRPSSNKYPSVHERSIPASSSVSSSRRRRRGRHRADPLANTKATQCNQSRERDGLPQEPRQPGRRKAKRPHSGPPELKNSERAGRADASDGKEERPFHEACAVSKLEARSHDARAARLERRSKKEYKQQAMANEADHSRVLPGVDSPTKAPDSNERESLRSRDAMPPPPLPVTEPSPVHEDTASRTYPELGNVHSPDREEETLVRAYERAGRGLGETHAEPVVAEEGGTSEHFQNRVIRAGGAILPLQSVSWIDPASRPATPSLTYNTQALGVGTRLAPCANTQVNALKDDRLVTEPAAPMQAEESIVEFIMRIESEAEAGMPGLRTHAAGLFEDEDTIRVDTTKYQPKHYEASEMQTPNLLGEKSWDPHMFHAPKPEAHVGNAAEPCTTGWEDAPEEQDLFFTWDPYQY